MGRIPKWMLVVLASLVCVPILRAQQPNASNETSVAGSVPRLVRFSGTLAERLAPYGMGHLGLAASISAMRRRVSFKAVTTLR